MSIDVLRFAKPMRIGSKGRDERLPLARSERSPILGKISNFAQEASQLIGLR
jgi:hypothetical protein